MRVLIVEDHGTVSRGLKEVLAEEFPELVSGEARSAPEAIAQLHSQPWDLVLLDINLPGRSGLGLITEAKRLSPKAAVLVVSGYPEEDFAIRALKLGADGYLGKDRAADELVAATKKVLAGGRYVTSSLAERLAVVIGGNFDQQPHEILSNRELQVLRLVAVGRTLKEIAGNLQLSEKTIGTYRARLAGKMRLSTNIELTRYALRHGLAE